MHAIDRHELRVHAGNEALIDLGAVEVRPRDRAGILGPVDVLAIDREPHRPAEAGDEALIDAGAIETRPPDRTATEEVALHPVDKRTSWRGDDHEAQQDDQRAQHGTQTAPTKTTPERPRRAHRTPEQATESRPRDDD